MSRDDVDDFEFLSHPRQGSSGYLLGDDRANNDWERKRQQLLEERREIEERTLQSSKSALGLMFESEKVGISTAEELLKQREQLSNAEEKLDTMNSTMRISQKHLTSMRSIFGGFKNYFSRSTDSQHNNHTISSRPAVREESDLSTSIDRIRLESTEKSAENHYVLANRGIDTSGFKWDDDDDTKSREVPKSRQRPNDERSARIERQLENNLNEIESGVGRLKNLALGLGSEITTQNAMVERITDKADRAGDTLNYQNRQMRQILKK